MPDYTLELNNGTIEKIAESVPRGDYRSVLFDFDGTISLIRQGWREIMIPMMVEELESLGTDESPEDLVKVVAEFVDRLTGKQTIYQMIQLCEEIRKRGGTPKDAIIYKQRYNDLLNTHIANRIQNLKTGAVEPDEYMLKGTRNLLENLVDRGLVLYLASGTDHAYVRQEADLLDVSRYFDGRIFGAQDNHENFSKAMVIQDIMKTHGIGGSKLIGFGDGYVEIENVKAVGGTAVGVASDEAKREGIDTWKRDRLIGVGADFIIPEYREQEFLISYLCDKQ
jgi:phosphoglycolate phosphatase